MSLTAKKRYCVFGCADLGAFMHSFPHPERCSEQFQKWVSVVGTKLKETDSWRIYKNKKICDYHFTSEQKVASHRLIKNEVPSLNLSGVQLTPGVSVLLEHSYCLPGAMAGVSSSLQQHSAGTSIDKELQSRIQPEFEHNQPSTSRANLDEGFKASESNVLKRYKAAQKQKRILNSQLIKSKKKVVSLKRRLQNVEKLLTEETSFEKITRKMTLSGKIFTGMQYRQALKKPKGRRYNIEEKILSLSIYKKSPKCYTLLSKYFKLPSAKSLKNLLNGIKIAPSINSVIFEKMKETVNALDVEDCLCTLIFDEMSITPHVQYDPYKDEFKGFITSESDELKLANHALVFMVKGIKKNFKQPVAYYFTLSLKTTELKNIIKDVIKNVQSTGLKIICTVCDQGTTNVSAINSLIADTKENYIKKGREWRHEIFEINGCIIIPLYDVPHLLKGVRNNLLSKDLKYTDSTDQNIQKVIKWEYFQMLYEADKSCGELRFLHKLTEEHIDPTKIKKMRVKMAAQIFSHSVAVTADHLTARKMLPEKCRQLVPFVLMLDKLFDSLNAGTFHIPNGKLYRAGVRKNSPHHNLWQEGIKFLKSVKFIAKKKMETKCD